MGFIIDQDMAEEFFDVLERVLLRMRSDALDELYCYVDRRCGIAISFDEDLLPFLGFTRGYNSDKWSREYLTDGHYSCELLESVGQALEDKTRRTHQSGSRLFLDDEGAFRVTRSGKGETILDWKWSAFDPESLVQGTIDLLRSNGAKLQKGARS